MIKKVYSFLFLLFCLFIISSCDDSSFDSLNNLYSKEDVIELFNNYYTSSEIDDFFKVNNNYLSKNYYSKEEVDSLIEEFKSHDNLNFIDVDELPQQSWKGTPIPTSGYVEKVYINTVLTPEEVDNIISTVTPNEVTEDYSAYNVLVDKDANSLITIYYWEDGYSIEINDGIEVYAYGEWFECDSPYKFDVEVSTEDFVIEQNDKLSNLFSITPFVATNININTIYKCNSNLYVFNNGWEMIYCCGVQVINGYEITPNEAGEYRISLSNGRYILNTNNLENDLTIDFGYAKGTNFGKFLNFSYNTAAFDDFIDLLTSGMTGMSSEIIIRPGKTYLIEVNDYFVSLIDDKAI